jgi:hypothetical protein
VLGKSKKIFDKLREFLGKVQKLLKGLKKSFWRFSIFVKLKVF